MTSWAQQELVSRRCLVEAMANLGIGSGQDVMVHAALSKLGYLVNGGDDLLDALVELVGETGTVLAPGHSGQLTDPEQWVNPPVPKAWIPEIREMMQPFNQHRTKLRNRGAFAESMFRLPSVKRSQHPIASVLAFGARSGYYTDTHMLHYSEGQDSPCKKLVDNNGRALLVGVDIDNCTALHVAEFEVDADFLYETNVRVLTSEGGARAFVKLDRYPSSSLYFQKLRRIFFQEKIMSETMIGACNLSVVYLKPAVELLAETLRKNEKFATI